jgi:hypothetical protein
MSRHRTTATVLIALLATWVFAGTAGAAVPRLIFPVVAATSYYNDFGAPRPSGGHQGNDLMAAKRSPVVAVEAGRAVKYKRSANAGCMLYLHGRSGTTYMYIHLNNDRTLRNDNRGGCRNGIAYARGLKSGEWVRAGELIAFVGNSGDANGIASHLHFEVHPNGGRAVSPYRRLRGAYRHLYARPSAGAVETLRMRIRGTVLEAFADEDPARVRLRVIRIRLSNGFVVKPARYVTLTVPPEATVTQNMPDQRIAITLADLGAGDPVVAWTLDAPETRASARARAGVHAIREIRRLLTN